MKFATNRHKLRREMLALTNLDGWSVTLWTASASPDTKLGAANGFDGSVPSPVPAKSDQPVVSYVDGDDSDGDFVVEEDVGYDDDNYRSGGGKSKKRSSPNKRKVSPKKHKTNRLYPSPKKSFVAGGSGSSGGGSGGGGGGGDDGDSTLASFEHQLTSFDSLKTIPELLTALKGIGRSHSHSLPPAPLTRQI